MRMHDDRSNMQVFVGGELFDLVGWGPGGLGWEWVEWNPGMEPWKDGGAWLVPRPCLSSFLLRPWRSAVGQVHHTSSSRYSLPGRGNTSKRKAGPFGGGDLGRGGHWPLDSGHWTFSAPGPPSVLASALHGSCSVACVCVCLRLLASALGTCMRLQMHVCRPVGKPTPR